MYILSLTILSFYSFGQILASNKKYVKLHTVKHCIWTEKENYAKSYNDMYVNIAVILIYISAIRQI